MSGRGSREVRLATRGSTLARRQTERVRAALADRRFDVEVVAVETTGDRVRDELVQNLGKTGAFVRSLDERVLAGDADFAVHSMKDMPTEMPEGLVVAGVPERASPGDALVTPDGATLDELPAGATVGTGSLRRRAQLLAERPNLEVVGLRGNVDTRIEKLLAPGLQAEHERRLNAEEGDDADGNGENDADGDGEADASDAGDDESEEETPSFDRSADEWFADLNEIERRALGREVDTEYDAVVLAVAGLERSGLAHAVPHWQLPTETFLPAPAQGALAVVGRETEVAERVRSVLDHPRSRLECAVERAVLAGVGGGCIAPIGVYARLRGPVVHVDVRVLDEDGETEVAAGRDLPVERPVAAARELAADLRDRGAAELIAAARDDQDEADAPRGDGP